MNIFADCGLINRFAVPFEEDEKDPKTFFLDLDYVEEMLRMFKKVNGSSAVPRPRIELICSKGTPDRILPYWSKTPFFRFGDYGIVQAILP